MAHSLKFETGDLLQTKDDEMDYLSEARLFPYHYLNIGLTENSVAWPEDIEPDRTYLCVEPARVFKGEYRKLVKILTGRGPRWCFASCFIRKRY